MKKISSGNLDFLQKESNKYDIESISKIMIKKNGEKNKFVTQQKIVRSVAEPKTEKQKCCRCCNTLHHKNITTLVKSASYEYEGLINLSWNGVPSCIRSKVWKILTGYIPVNPKLEQAVLDKKRKEFNDLVEKYININEKEYNNASLRQILIDIPRTHPNMKYLKNESIFKLYEKVLYIWAGEHPDSGYVQGMNDLIAPFLIVYLYDYVGYNYDTDNFSNINGLRFDNLEADIYWMFSNLMDVIHDNYIPDQPGIQKRVKKLENIVSLADKKLHDHLTENSVSYLQFALRWMNNLLVRELPIDCIIRLWDTYLSEEGGFDDIHLYVCAALLISFSKIIVRLDDFQEISYFVQNLPTHSWNEEDINVLLAEAYQLHALYSGYTKNS